MQWVSFLKWLMLDELPCRVAGRFCKIDVGSCRQGWVHLEARILEHCCSLLVVVVCCIVVLLLLVVQVINLSWPVRVSLHKENKLLMLLGFIEFFGS